MRSFSATSLIDAPLERVWYVIADVLRWPQWLPTVTSIEALGPPALAIGARYRIVQPRLRPVVWTVVELVPQSRFDWESHSLGVRVLAGHVLNAKSGGSTSVLHQITLSGAFAGLAGLIAGRMTREYIEREAASLKQRVESMPP